MSRPPLHADSEEDEEDQNSEGSTDSEEELNSPQRIYQVRDRCTQVTHKTVRGAQTRRRS